MRTPVKHLILITTLFAGSLSAGEPVPYGHKDFVPTPEQPVYFRQTYGYYPGATPPMEWWDGTPTTRKVKGVFGNPPKHKEIDALVLGDTKAKNIRWKMPVPTGDKLLIQSSAFLYCIGAK